MDEIRYFSDTELKGIRFMPNPCGRLPGYQDSATMDAVVKSPDWTPVLSLSVFRRHPEYPYRLQTYTGVRRELSESYEENEPLPMGSTTHGGVVSTLTAQFPTALQFPLLEERKRFLILNPFYKDMSRVGAIGMNGGPDSRDTAVLARYDPNIDSMPEQQRILPYLLQDIIARKLGAPKLLDSNLGKVSLHHVRIGLSYIGDDPELGRLWEALVMYGATLMLWDDARDSLPASSDRYSWLGWTDNVDTFEDDVRVKSVEMLAPYVPENEAVEYCARGLCLATTAGVIQSPDLDDHLGIKRVRVRGANRPRILQT